MNRAIALWSTAFAMTGLSLGAQAPTTQTTPPPAPGTVAAAPASVTGCLRAWSEGAGQPAASPAETRAAGTPRFTLTQIERTAAQPAAAAVSPSTTEELRLLLVPTGNIDLAAHVNTIVAVTGTIAAEADGRPVGTSGRQPETATDAKLQKPQEAHAYRNMAVTAVVPTAKTCDKS